MQAGVVMTGETLSRQIFDAAFALIERTEGDVEFARHLWGEAFEEAERIDANQNNAIAADMMDDREHEIVEQTDRFERAIEARKNFRVVRNTDPEDTL
jgi:hypothetical protein